MSLVEPTRSDLARSDLVRSDLAPPDLTRSCVPSSPITTEISDGPRQSIMGERLPHRLSAIGLDELNAQAELQTRVDAKYLVPQQLFASLVAEAERDLRILTIDGARAFEYTSVYFDTPDLASFRAHVQRRRRRFKVRTRTYGQSGECFVEVKTKGARSETVKDRVPHDARCAAMLTRGAQDFVRDLVPDAEVEALVPSLQTRYVRATLLDVAGQSRITADTSLVFRHGVLRAEMDDAFVLVETKSADGAGQADRWLWRHRVRPVSISKYCAGVAMLYPQVVMNPWHRVLHQHFIWG